MITLINPTIVWIQLDCKLRSAWTTAEAKQTDKSTTDATIFLCFDEEKNLSKIAGRLVRRCVSRRWHPCRRQALHLAAHHARPSRTSSSNPVFVIWSSRHAGRPTSVDTSRLLQRTCHLFSTFHCRHAATRAFFALAKRPGIVILDYHSTNHHY